MRDVGDVKQDWGYDAWSQQPHRIPQVETIVLIVSRTKGAGRYIHQAPYLVARNIVEEYET